MSVKDKKITILHNTSDGTTKANWQPLTGGTNIWASYRHASGHELYEAAATQVEKDVVFEINWRNDLTEKMRILYKSKTYEITQIDDFEGNKTGLKVFCKIYK